MRRGNGDTDCTERGRIFGFLEQVENAIQRHPPSLSACNYTRVCVHHKSLPGSSLLRDMSAVRHLLRHFFELLLLWHIPCLKQLDIER
jgi:hypothetical protein